MSKSSGKPPVELLPLGPLLLPMGTRVPPTESELGPRYEACTDDADDGGGGRPGPPTAAELDEGSAGCDCGGGSGSFGVGPGPKEGLKWSDRRRITLTRLRERQRG